MHYNGEYKTVHHANKIGFTPHQLYLKNYLFSSHLLMAMIVRCKEEQKIH